MHPLLIVVAGVAAIFALTKEKETKSVQSDQHRKNVDSDRGGNRRRKSADVSKQPRRQGNVNKEKDDEVSPKRSNVSAGVRSGSGDDRGAKLPSPGSEKHPDEQVTKESEEKDDES